MVTPSIAVPMTIPTQSGFRPISRPLSARASSPAAKAYFDNTNFEIAIVSALAFTPEHGFSCNSQTESDLLKQVFKEARHVYMMLDSSKVGKINPYTFAHLEDIDVLITDDVFPREYKALFEENDIVVM